MAARIVTRQITVVDGAGAGLPNSPQTFNFTGANRLTDDEAIIGVLIHYVAGTATSFDINFHMVDSDDNQYDVGKGVPHGNNVTGTNIDPGVTSVDGYVDLRSQGTSNSGGLDGLFAPPGGNVRIIHDLGGAADASTEIRIITLIRKMMTPIP